MVQKLQGSSSGRSNSTVLSEHYGLRDEMAQITMSPLNANFILHTTTTTATTGLHFYSLCLSLSPSFSKRYLHSLKPIRASVLTDSSNVSPVLNLYIFPIYSYTLQSWRLFSFLLSLSLSICVNIIALLLYTPTYTPSHRHTGTEEAPYFTMLSGKLWRNFNRLTLGWWVKFWDFRQSPPKALL